MKPQKQALNPKPFELELRSPMYYKSKVMKQDAGSEFVMKSFGLRVFLGSGRLRV